jgi:hypothetical protein
MQKKCALSWREAHFEVKMLKTPQAQRFWKLSRQFLWQAQWILHLKEK